VDILFAELTPYLGSTIAHDCELQTLLVQNGSFEIGRNQWRNEVLLRNRATDQWDVIYPLGSIGPSSFPKMDDDSARISRA